MKVLFIGGTGTISSAITRQPTSITRKMLPRSSRA